MRDDLAIILGGLSAPARALTARLLANPQQRVVLVDREDPVAALTSERAPMLGHEAPVLVSRDWRMLVERGQLSGVTVDREPIPTIVGTLGLLRPARIVLCISMRSDTTKATRLAPALTAFTTELAASLAAINEYCRLLHEDARVRPRIVIAVAGSLSVNVHNGLASIARGLMTDLLTETGSAPHLVLLPRVLGGGAQLDLTLQRVLRRLLQGEPIRAQAEPAAAAHWITAGEAAEAMQQLLEDTHRCSDSCFPPGEPDTGPSRLARGGSYNASHIASPVTSHIMSVAGHPLSLDYLARVAAHEMDCLLPDPLVRRTSLVQMSTKPEHPDSHTVALADAVRFTVRWHAANATLLTAAA